MKSFVSYKNAFIRTSRLTLCSRNNEYTVLFENKTKECQECDNLRFKLCFFTNNRHAVKHLTKITTVISAFTLSAPGYLIKPKNISQDLSVI